MTEKRVTLHLLTRDSNLERGIGETLLNNADEFDYILRHRESYGGKEPRDLTDGKLLRQGAGIKKLLEGAKLPCNYFKMFYMYQF